MILKELLADSKFRTVAAQCAIGKKETSRTIVRELRDNIQNPAIVGIACRRNVVTCPARVVLQFILCPPCFLVEWRICHDEVSLQVFVLVVMECVSSHLAEVAGNATNGEVHLRQFVSGVGIFLTIDGDIALVTVMCLDEFHALYEHTARTTTRIIYLATIRLYHLGNKVDNGLRRVVFTFTLAFGNGKLTEEVFIYTTDEIVLRIFQRVNLVDFIKQSSKFGAVERQTSIVVAGQGSFQRRIALLHFR